MSKECSNGHQFIGQNCDRCGGIDILETPNIMNEEEVKVEGEEEVAETAPETSPEVAPEAQTEEVKPEGEEVKSE